MIRDIKPKELLKLLGEVLPDDDEPDDTEDAADVAAEIRDLLWEVAEIDADVKAEARYDEDVYREDTFDEERRWFYLGLA